MNPEWTMITHKNDYVIGMAEIRDSVLVWRTNEEDPSKIGEPVPIGYKLVTNNPDILSLYQPAGILTKGFRLPEESETLAYITIKFTTSSQGTLTSTGFHPSEIIKLPDHRLVIGSLGMGRYRGYTSFDEYVSEQIKSRNETISVINVSVDERTDDNTRIIVSKFLNRPIPTQVAQKQATQEMWDRIHMDLEAQRIVREGRQVTDNEPIIAQPDAVTQDNCKFFTKDESGKMRDIFRLRATGLTFTSDFGKDFRQNLADNGAQIIYDAPAITDGYAGTWQNALREIKYKIGNDIRWVYIALHSDIDSWSEECWTTNHRLTGGAAVDTILAARKIVEGDKLK
jgi:hypothetical protein